MTSGPYYFMPKTRSNMAVSPKFWALTILPSRNVNTSASGADYPPAVTLREDDHDIVVGRKEGALLQRTARPPSKQFRDPGLAAIRPADRAVTGHDKLESVVVVAQDSFDVAPAPTRRTRSWIYLRHSDL